MGYAYLRDGTRLDYNTYIETLCRIAIRHGVFCYEMRSQFGHVADFSSAQKFAVPFFEGFVLIV